MIEKQIVFSSNDENCTIDVISSNAPLEKLASNRMSDEIKDYIANHIKKDPRYVYVLVSALGAGEYWGCNVNADYFPQDEILKSFKTFEEYGHVFTHHQNKDPKKSKGDILLSHYNPRMKRVELVVRIEREKAPDISGDIDKGKMWDVSMGCKVPYDVCSICGNKAYTKNDYCEHIRFNKGKILPDGRQVYMINMSPRFFDISFVFIGADRTAKSLLKIASAVPNTKTSSIDKEVPGETISKEPNDVAKVLLECCRKLKQREKNLPKELLEKYKEFDLSELLSSLASVGVVLKPQEFDFLHNGEKINLSEKKNSYINNSIRPFMKERSGLKGFLYPRLIRKMYEDPAPEEKVTVVYRKYLNSIPGVTRHSGIPTGYMVSGVKTASIPDDNWDGLKLGMEDLVPDELINEVTAGLLEPKLFKKAFDLNGSIIDPIAGKAITKYFE